MKQKPEKIIFDASPLLVNRTGVAYYTEQLISQLARQYPDVTFVGFYFNFLGRRPTDHFPKAPNIRYRPVRLLPGKIVYQLRRWGIEVPLELLAKERADFVIFDNFLGYPSLFKTPAAPVVHDLTYLDLPQYVAAKNRSDLERFVPQQIARSVLVITVSEFSKQKIAAQYHVPSAQVVVTPIPPDTPKPYGVKEQQVILKKLGIIKPFILFLGTVEPRKNIPNLIDAYAALPDELRHKYSLVIAGRIGWNCDKEIARLEQARREGLNVIHVGYVDEQAKAVLYQATTLFTHASFYEGFGMPVLEAMSYGRPCIVSDIPVFKEVAGAAAQYWNQDDPQDMTKKLARALNNQKLLGQMSQNSLQRVAAYSWKVVATNFYQALRERLAELDKG